MKNENIEKIINLIIAVGKKLPPPARDIVGNELEVIKELLMDNRAPRMLVLGRQGAGKSSIINALFKANVAKVGSVTSDTGGMCAVLVKCLRTCNSSDRF